MDLRKLRQFVVVAEELNFRRAAERLHMAQPPLSFAIQQLESMFGVELLKRGKQSVSLTPAGKLCLDEARRILSAVDRTTHLVRQASSGTVGLLRLHFAPTAAYEFLPAALAGFSAKYPEVELDLTEATTSDIAGALRSGSADLGVVRYLSGYEREFEHRVARDEEVVVALPASHPLAERHKLRLKELADEDFIASHRIRVPAGRMHIEHLCRLAGFEPRVRHEAITVPTIVSLVSAGLGISLVPQSAQALPHKGVIYRRLLDPAEWTRTRLFVIWKPDGLSSLGQNFINSLEPA